MKRLVGALLMLAATPALAQQTAVPPAPGQADQLALTRSLLEALRANTEAQQRNSTALEALVGQLGRTETAARAVPPSVDGLRTDVVAIRAMVDRLTQATRRGAATLRFGPFACAGGAEAVCATNACKSVGYANGVVVTAIRDGGKTTGISEATCYD